MRRVFQARGDGRRRIATPHSTLTAMERRAAGGAPRDIARRQRGAPVIPGPVVCSAGAIDGQDGLVRGRAGCQGHGRHVYLQPLPLRHPLEGFHRCCGQGGQHPGPVTLLGPCQGWTCWCRSPAGILGEGRRLRRHLFQLDGDAPPGRPRRDGAGCHRRGVPLPLPLRRDAGEVLAWLPWLPALVTATRTLLHATSAPGGGKGL